MFHGKGGYDWFTVYNMPIWLRKFTYNNIKEYYSNLSNQTDNSLVNDGNINETSLNNIKEKYQELSHSKSYSTKIPPKNK